MRLALRLALRSFLSLRLLLLAPPTTAAGAFMDSWRLTQARTLALWRLLWLAFFMARVFIVRLTGALTDIGLTDLAMGASALGAASFLLKSLNSPFLATWPSATRRLMATRPAAWAFFETIRPFLFCIRSSFLRPPDVRKAVPWKTMAFVPTFTGEAGIFSTVCLETFVAWSGV